MPGAIEIVNAFATNPGVGPGFAATTLFTGDTAAIRNFNTPARTYLKTMWAAEAAAGVVRIRSPRLHDFVQNLRFRVGAVNPRQLIPDWVEQIMYAQDTLIADLFGGAAETDGMAWCIYYQSLDGSSARLYTWEAIKPRIANYVTVEVANAGGAAIGAYSAALAINSLFDDLQANTDYALLGYDTDTTGLSVGIRGPDTGNLRLGGPMTTEKLQTQDWFVRLDTRSPDPWIPVINSANRGATLVDNAQVVAGVAANITLFLAELAH